MFFLLNPLPMNFTSTKTKDIFSPSQMTESLKQRSSLQQRRKSRKISIRDEDQNFNPCSCLGQYLSLRHCCLAIAVIFLVTGVSYWGTSLYLWLTRGTMGLCQELAIRCENEEYAEMVDNNKQDESEDEETTTNENKPKFCPMALRCRLQAMADIICTIIGCSLEIGSGFFLLRALFYNATHLIILSIVTTVFGGISFVVSIVIRIVIVTKLQGYTKIIEDSPYYGRFLPFIFALFVLLFVLLHIYFGMCITAYYMLVQPRPYGGRQGENSAVTQKKRSRADGVSYYFPQFR